MASALARLQYQRCDVIVRACHTHTHGLSVRRLSVEVTTYLLLVTGTGASLCDGWVLDEPKTIIFCGQSRSNRDNFFFLFPTPPITASIVSYFQVPVAWFAWIKLSRATPTPSTYETAELHQFPVYEQHPLRLLFLVDIYELDPAKIASWLTHDVTDSDVFRSICELDCAAQVAVCVCARTGSRHNRGREHIISFSTQRQRRVRARHIPCRT